MDVDIYFINIYFEVIFMISPFDFICVGENWNALRCL